MPDFRFDTFNVTSVVLAIIAIAMIIALLAASPAEPESASAAQAQQETSHETSSGATRLPGSVAPSALLTTPLLLPLRDSSVGSEGRPGSKDLPPVDLDASDDSHVVSSADLPDTSTAVTGKATWLCDPPTYRRCTRGYNERAMVAARGSEIPRSWQGKIVTVSWRGRSVDVRLVDTCACKGARIIDLYAKPFRQLCACVPEVVGVLRGVSVTLKGATRLPYLPPTSTAR